MARRRPGAGLNAVAMPALPVDPALARVLASGAGWFDLVAPVWGALHPPAGPGASLPFPALDAAVRAVWPVGAVRASPRFVAQEGLRYDSYEAFIARTGCVPTRTQGAGAVHDLLNALVWIAMPRAKCALNAVHARALVRSGPGGPRGQARDRATLFDENGAVLVTDSPSLARAAREADWHGLFADPRAPFGERARVRVFGHALIHKLFTPYKAICAHALVIDGDPATPDRAIDAMLAERIAGTFDAGERQVQDAAAARAAEPSSGGPDTARARGRVLHPLPLCGVPGWWPGNDDPAFYDDATVFRPARDGGDEAAGRQVVTACEERGTCGY